MMMAKWWCYEEHSTFRQGRIAPFTLWPVGEFHVGWWSIWNTGPALQRVGDTYPTQSRVCRGQLQADYQWVSGWGALSLSQPKGPSFPMTVLCFQRQKPYKLEMCMSQSWSRSQVAEGRALGENSPLLSAEVRFTLSVYCLFPSSSAPYHVTISPLHLYICALLILVAYESVTYLLNLGCEWLEHRI